MEPKEIFEKAYSILVEHAGAPRLEHYSETFVKYFLTKHGHEWRFQGSLGFGGKFWRNDQRYYVSCYPEERNVKRDAVILKVNALLAELPYYEP